MRKAPMEKAATFRNVEREMERFMINLFKRRIRQDGLNPRNLKGTWSEASAILRAHFGKVTRMADQNQHKLLNFYRAAVDELKPDRI
jgi:hypothetical protein